jgi:hypothetical protein
MTARLVEAADAPVAVAKRDETFAQQLHARGIAVGVGDFRGEQRRSIL